MLGALAFLGSKGALLSNPKTNVQIDQDQFFDFITSICLNIYRGCHIKPLIFPGQLWRIFESWKYDFTGSKVEGRVRWRPQFETGSNCSPLFDQKPKVSPLPWGIPLRASKFLTEFCLEWKQYFVCLNEKEFGAERVYIYFWGAHCLKLRTRLAFWMN